MATIPRILLDDRAVDPPDPPSSPLMTTSATNGPLLGAGGERSAAPGAGYVPQRCNSDIGLPAASMPNLPLALGAGQDPTQTPGDTLGVYCSPRASRRSVDLHVGSSATSARDPAVEYEWLEDRPSSLQVLSAGSRVGSALSLTSVCTAHSVGLLSNDSSDEYQDSFLPEVGLLTFPPHADRAGHLRRLQSNPEAPEDKAGSDVTPRTSHSLCNLKAVQAPAVGQGQGQGQGQPRGQLTPEKLCLLPSEVDECGEGHGVPPGGKGKGGEEEGGEGGKPTVAEMEVVEERPLAAMVSYGKGSSTMREGRIRRWLQDMDKASE